jgi:NitT/TauT family transport system substrate-binding protein
VRLTRFLALAAAVVFLAAATACGGDDDEQAAPTPPAETEAADTGVAAGGETTSITVASPFPSCLAFFPVYVAIERGYFADEGLEVTVEPLDGSGAAIQAVLSDRAQIAMPSPGPFMQAVEKGAALQDFYTMYQGDIFSVVVPEDSDVQSVADLEGTKVGIGSPDGGEVPYVKSLLTEAAGLGEGDYELVTVGDGGSAAVALDRGDVDAYGAAFIDIAIMRQRGLALRALTDPDYPTGIDTLSVAKDEWVAENEEAVKGYGRALARATTWAVQNPEGTVDACAKSFPDETTDREFALALLNEVITLTELPAEAEGKYGYSPIESLEPYRDFLVEQGELETAVDLGIFNNGFLDDYNDFDPDQL